MAAIKRFSSSELLGFPNCMGLSERGKCIWLNINTCKGETCSFKRSALEYNSSYAITCLRLARLSVLKQMKIANKYFKGKRPWSE